MKYTFLPVGGLRVSGVVSSIVSTGFRNGSRRFWAAATSAAAVWPPEPLVLFDDSAVAVCPLEPLVLFDELLHPARRHRKRAIDAARSPRTARVPRRLRVENVYIAVPPGL